MKNLQRDLKNFLKSELDRGYKINYVDQIYKAFDNAGYVCNHWLLDASKMGVPQRRERVFFIALRKDITIFNYQASLFKIRPKIDLNFKE